MPQWGMIYRVPLVEAPSLFPMRQGNSSGYGARFDGETYRQQNVSGIGDGRTTLEPLSYLPHEEQNITPVRYTERNSNKYEL